MRSAERSGLEGLAELDSVPLISRSSGDEAAFAKLAKQHTAPLGERTQLKRAMDAGRLFLTVCNPYDKRKNLAALVEGFLMATAGVEDAVLLVKLVTSGIFESPTGYLFHQIRVLFGNPHCLHEDKIVLFSSFLSEEEMSELYANADFYISAAIAEGQNLPLLESMAHGCVPISTRHTAMLDYIAEENAVVIESRRYRGLIPLLASDVAQSRVEIDFSDRYQIADAIRRALALTPDQLAAKRKAARGVADRYGDDSVFAQIRTRLAAIDKAPSSLAAKISRWIGR